MILLDAEVGDSVVFNIKSVDDTNARSNPWIGDYLDKVGVITKIDSPWLNVEWPDGRQTGYSSEYFDLAPKNKLKDILERINTIIKQLK